MEMLHVNLHGAAVLLQASLFKTVRTLRDQVVTQNFSPHKLSPYFKNRGQTSLVLFSKSG